jgi:hypothetical protein
MQSEQCRRDAVEAAPSDVAGESPGKAAPWVGRCRRVWVHLDTQQDATNDLPYDSEAGDYRGEQLPSERRS